MELDHLVFKLTSAQLQFLVKRFTGCDNDEEALESVGFARSTYYKKWKSDPVFAEAYAEFQRQGPDIFRPLVEAIFAASAAVAAIEQRKIIETPNSELDTRAIASKYTAINEVLDRAVPKKTVSEQTFIFKLSDLKSIKPQDIIEGEIVEVKRIDAPHDERQEDKESDGKGVR